MFINIYRNKKNSTVYLLKYQRVCIEIKTQKNEFLINLINFELKISEVYGDNVI